MRIFSQYLSLVPNIARQACARARRRTTAPLIFSSLRKLCLRTIRGGDLRLATENLLLAGLQAAVDGRSAWRRISRSRRGGMSANRAQAGADQEVQRHVQALRRLNGRSGRASIGLEGREVRFASLDQPAAKPRQGRTFPAVGTRGQDIGADCRRWLPARSQGQSS